MRKSGILAGLAVAGLLTAGASAGIFEDNSGLWRNNTGGWEPTGNAGSQDHRDNVGAAGDNWLGQNGMHIFKSPYGEQDGLVPAEGFTGIFRSSQGTDISATYTFVAPSAITSQDWVTKVIVNRSADAVGGLSLSVKVNGGSFQIVDSSSTFYSANKTGDILLPAVYAGWGFDGPTELRTADLSSLGIQAGDTVEYRIGFKSGSDEAIGLGVQFIPEPASLALLGLGGLALLRRRSA